MVRQAYVALCAALAALLCAAAAAGANTTVSVSGAGAYTQNGGAETFRVGARSDLDGTNPEGNVTVDALGQGTFHGDVSQGCLRVVGNHAVVVGLLPESEQFLSGSGRLIEYVALFVEDNGPPERGQPVDRVASLLLSAAGERLVCAGGQPGALATVPLERGNVRVDDGS
jgi:hypothetical protein